MSAIKDVLVHGLGADPRARVALTVRKDLLGDSRLPAWFLDRWGQYVAFSIESPSECSEDALSAVVEIEGELHYVDIPYHSIQQIIFSFPKPGEEAFPKLHLVEDP